ncbi:MAG: RNA polymerase factor sigma-54 [Peptostreptococcaceae bacterium]
MKINQSIELNQKVTINKTIKKSLDILTFNSLELEDKIKEESLENPLIEFDEKIIDWSKYFKDLNRRSGEYNTYDKDDFLENIVNKKTYREELEEQVNLFLKDKQKIKICCFLINNFDEDGYIKDFENIQFLLNENYGYDLNLIESSLIYLQNLNENGIGARSLSERLLIQLKNKKNWDELIENIVVNDLELVVNNKLKDIQKKYKKSIEEIANCIDCIKKLNPSIINEKEKNLYLKPDVVVKKINDKFIVLDNDEIYKNININNSYIEILENTEDLEVKKYINEKLNSFKELSNNIIKRKETLIKITDEIIKIQIDFFKKGKRHLKPMSMKEIAQKLNLSESTVSRALSNKYLMCENGIFEIKYLFSVFKKENENSISNNNIKEIIKMIIEDENPKKPFSDEIISQKLKKENIDVARRTVAKYREELNILSSSKRKKY